jgi:hypothetical protein
MKSIRVETYSGYKADEYPKRFWIDDQMIEVMDIEDRWYGPGYSYFKVFASNAKRYILKQDHSSNSWEATTV